MNSIPNTDVVIGHYSSLLPFWGIHKKKVVTISLPGHEIDESIKSWSYSVDISKLEMLDLCKVDYADDIKCRYICGDPFKRKILLKEFFKN